MLVRDRHLYESPVKDLLLHLWLPDISIIVTEGALLIFLQSGVKRIAATARD